MGSSRFCFHPSLLINWTVQESSRHSGHPHGQGVLSTFKHPSKHALSRTKCEKEEVHTLKASHAARCALLLTGWESPAQVLGSGVSNKLLRS